MTTADLTALSRGGGGAEIARPKSRMLTRVVVPGVIILCALGLLAYAARESLRPAVEVTVVPVVQAPMAGGATGGPATGGGGGVVQAPGWIEADPYDVGVPALATGVLKELLVLEGQKVEAGQVIAKLVDDDAKLTLRRAEAGVEQADAALDEARAQESADTARAAEVHDEFNRKQSLVKGGAISEGEVVELRLRVSAHDAVCVAAKAAVRKADAEAHLARVMLDEAKLNLDRMQVRAPVAGVVLARLVVPGQRLMPDANNPFAGVVVRLYDPAHLQVRVDVPLADAARVRIGDSVEVTTETLPGRAFHGTLTRFAHEANVQKNTVQVKVAIADPAPELKPEMLAKAKVTTRAVEAASAPGMGSMPGMPGMTGSMGDSGTALMVPRAAIVQMSGMPEMAWVLDQPTSTAQMRHLRLGRVIGDSVEVLEGLRPGDRVIVNAPATVKDGTKIRVKEGS